MNIKDHTVLNAAEAENLGFIIEGDFCFFFDLGCTIAVLGYNTLNRVWQFDTAVNEEGDTWQFTCSDLHTALERANAVTKVMNGVTEFLRKDEVSSKDIDHVEILNTMFKGCAGVAI